MLIKYIQREHLDEEKYNDCIENSIQSNSYAFSWYLDIVCDNWDVLVLMITKQYANSLAKKIWY